MRASCGLVEEEMVSAHCGVVVPKPMTDVVAEYPIDGCVQASYAVRPEVPEPTQTPLIAKQPAVRLMPLAAVEVALPVISRRCTLVEPVDESSWRIASEVVEKVDGDEVPKVR